MDGIVGTQLLVAAAAVEVAPVAEVVLVTVDVLAEVVLLGGAEVLVSVTVVGGGGIAGELEGAEFEGLGDDGVAGLVAGAGDGWAGGDCAPTQTSKVTATAARLKALGRAAGVDGMRNEFTCESSGCQQRPTATNNFHRLNPFRRKCSM